MHTLLCTILCVLMLVTSYFCCVMLCSFHFAGSDIAHAADYSRFVDQRGLYISISYSNNNDYNKF